MISGALIERWWGTRARAVLIAAAACLGACTNVHIYDEDGTVEVSSRFGIAVIQIPESDRPLLFDARGIGIVTWPDGAVLGYHHINAAALPRDDCRIVFWIQPGEAAAGLGGAFDQGADICTVSMAAR